MKIFTIEEANALLPTVRLILLKIQRCHRKIDSYGDEVKLASDAGDHGGGGLSDGLRYAELLMELTDTTSQIEDLGVQSKTSIAGVIDFPSLREGRVVLLCWQIGEGDEVAWWHDVDAGFAGRTPL